LDTTCKLRCLPVRSPIASSVHNPGGFYPCYTRADSGVTLGFEALIAIVSSPRLHSRGSSSLVTCTSKRRLHWQQPPREVQCTRVSPAPFFISQRTVHAAKSHKNPKTLLILPKEIRDLVVACLLPESVVQVCLEMIRLPRHADQQEPRHASVMSPNLYERPYA
jgi:hypothetical protein